MVQEEGEMKMGWLYYTPWGKDVFVSNVTSYRLSLCDVVTHSALWYNEEKQEWVESNLSYFRPPKENHR